VEIKPKVTGLNGIEVCADNGWRFEIRDEVEAAALRVAKEWIDQTVSDSETREELEKCMDALARRFAETHDEEVRAEILELARGPAEMKMLH
jgi:Lon protease-like protein